MVRYINNGILVDTDLQLERPLYHKEKSDTESGEEDEYYQQIESKSVKRKKKKNDATFQRKKPPSANIGQAKNCDQHECDEAFGLGYQTRTFLSIDEVEIESVRISLHESKKVVLSYGGVPQLRVKCEEMKVCKLDLENSDYLDRKVLTLVVEAPENLSALLSAWDKQARSLLKRRNVTKCWLRILNKGSPLAPRSSPTVRMDLSTEGTGDAAEVLHMNNREVDFYSLTVEEQLEWLKPGAHVDAYFSIEAYDFRGTGGIELKPEKIIIN